MSLPADAFTSLAPIRSALSPTRRLRVSRLCSRALGIVLALGLPWGCDGGQARLAAPTEGPNGPTLNSVQTIESDMRALNDLPLAGVAPGPGWVTGPGHVVMGNDPRGSRTPAWWQPADPRYKSDAWWTVLVPWLVVFDGVGHDAPNTRVQVRAMKVHVLSRRSGRWVTLPASPGLQGALYGKSLQGSAMGAADLRQQSDGSTLIVVPGGDRLFHGWCCGRLTIDAPDLAAVVITLQARLVANGPDDRDRARLLLQVGGDYYPATVTDVNAFAPARYNPGIGLSRAKRLTPDWQAFNFATIDAGVQDPGGASISVAALRALPPPLD